MNKSLEYLRWEEHGRWCCWEDEVRPEWGLRARERPVCEADEIAISNYACYMETGLLPLPNIREEEKQEVFPSHFLHFYNSQEPSTWLLSFILTLSRITSNVQWRRGSSAHSSLLNTDQNKFSLKIIYIFLHHKIFIKLIFKLIFKKLFKYINIAFKILVG